MEPDKEYLRLYKCTGMELGDSPLKIHQDLESMNGTSCCYYEYDTACRAIRRFHSGRKELTDGPPSGTPKAAMNENAIELVRHSIADDPHISIQEITEIC